MLLAGDSRIAGIELPRHLDVTAKVHLMAGGRLEAVCRLAEGLPELFRFKLMPVFFCSHMYPAVESYLQDLVTCPGDL